MSKVGTIIAPPKNENIPNHAQWLGGIGAGTWFCIDETSEITQGIYRIRRYNPSGELECDRKFKVSNLGFDLNQKHQFTYISHCKFCKILQNGTVFDFSVLSDGIVL